MRFRSSLKWLLLSINALFLLLLICAMLPPRGGASAMTREVAWDYGKVARELEMDVYSIKDPFAILVDKSFPGKGGFTLLIRDRPFYISAGDATGGAPKGVRMVFGLDLSLACDYYAEQGRQVHQIMLSKRDECLIDMNADGRWDKRIRIPKEPPEKSPPLEIWYRDRWEETVLPKSKLGRYDAQLRSGQVVSFDMESGRWLSPTDKAAAARGKVTHEEKKGEEKARGTESGKSG